MADGGTFGSMWGQINIKLFAGRGPRHYADWSIFMKYYHAAGTLCLLSICLTLEGGATVRKEDVPKYLKMLQTSKNAKDRAKAAEMLGKRGAINVNDVRDALDPLKTSVRKDIDASVRKEAATALAAIGTDKDETIPLLTDVVKTDKSMDVKLAAVQALAVFGPDAKSALPAIRELAKAQKDNKRVTAVIRAATKAIVAKK
jgi:hypothetical protein